LGGRRRFGGRAFAELFALNEAGNPYPRDANVVEELKQAKLLQRPAPLPWRQQELEYLQKGLGLETSGPA
jgi:hypothetical protein